MMLDARAVAESYVESYNMKWIRSLREDVVGGALKAVSIFTTSSLLLLAR